MLAEGDAAGAARSMPRCWRTIPPISPALAGLAQCYVDPGAIEQAKQTLAMVPESKRNDAAVKAVQAAIELAEQAQVGRPGHRAGTESRGKPARSSGALRSRHRAQRARQARRGDRATAGDRQARPQMERRRRAQAARAVLRGLGRRRRSDRRGAQAAVVDPVLVRLSYARNAGTADADQCRIPRTRRTARNHSGVSAARRAAAAARPDAAQHFRAALSRDGRRRACATATG